MYTMYNTVRYVSNVYDDRGCELEEEYCNVDSLNV
jgi:hypothetical protein